MIRLRLPLLGVGLLAICAAGPLHAQQPTDSLSPVLRALGARLDSLERGQCPGGPAITVPAGADSVTRAVAALARRLERVVAARCALPATPEPATADSATDELAALRAAADAATGTTPTAAADTTRAEPVFISKQRNASAMNPEVSATGDIRFEARDRSPQRDNALAREFEVALQSTLDPYSSAKVFIALEDGEVGVEEGYVTYTGLPGRLRIDAGRMRQSVGDLNRWHLHALPEGEYPLVYQRYFGDEGLAGTGLSLYTALPLSLAHGTHELWLQGTTAESDPLYAGSRQPTLLARLQNFWQLSPSTYAQVGVTGMGGNSADSALQSRVVGADVRFTWRPPSAGTRREVTLRAEGYRFHATVAGVRSTRYGGFADANVRVSRRWILGMRGDWLEAPRGAYATEWQLTPTLTWWQSEFVYLRLEGQETGGSSISTDARLRFQVVFAMGPHKHETY